MLDNIRLEFISSNPVICGETGGAFQFVKNT